MARQTDPTRTTLLRRRFEGVMRKRFREIKGAIRDLVIDLDAFGLIEGQPFMVNVEQQEFRFQTDEQKTASFRRWFQGQVDEKVLAVGVAGDPFSAEFVESAYRQGTVRSFTEARKVEMAGQVPGFVDVTRAEFLRGAFAQPERISKIRLLSTRAFEALRGVTADMAQQLNRVLADGLTRGLGPRQLATEMARTVDNITRRRALVIARTEIIHAHSEGQLDAFRDLRIEEVGVLAEWSTAGDDRVCPRCAPLDGVIMTIDEARGLIPRHPNCRCAWVPAPAVDDRQRRSRFARQVGRSIRAESPGRSAREARRRTTWVGRTL